MRELKYLEPIITQILVPAPQPRVSAGTVETFLQTEKQKLIVQNIEDPRPPGGMVLHITTEMTLLL